MAMDLNNITQDEFERIEAYLNHLLSKEEVIEFEEQLKNDKEFAAKVEIIKTTITGIETQALKEQLNDFHDGLDSPEQDATSSKPKLRNLQWRRIAVAAVLVIAFGSYWFFSMNSNQNLYAEFYTPDPGLPTAMSNTDKYEFYNAMVAYKRGEYEDALKTWNNQLNTKPANDTLNYFVGSALMADQQANKAIAYFQEVIEQDRSVFKNEALYYIGLAFLKNDNETKAIEYLQQADLTKARDLLQKLK